MRQLGQHTYWLAAAVGARCYWFDAGDRVAIVDPGLRAGLNPIARELREAGRSPYEVTDILLTHYDFDHSAAAAEWQRRTGARVWLGAADAAILTGAAPPPSPFRRATAALGLPELPRNLHLLDGDAELWPGVHAIHTPGHTPGHHSFRYDRTLFVGDTALAGPGRVVPMPRLLMSDAEQGLADLARLRAQDVDWWCCGHSDPARRRD